MSDSITITPSAYSLLILHASKHPSNSILGLLVGRVTSNAIQVESVVPLLHHHTSLGTMSQVASSLVQAHLNSKAGAEKQQILGAYQGNANKDDKDPNGSTKALVGRIAQLSGLKKGLLLVIQSHLLLSPTSLSLSSFLVSPANSSSNSTSLATQSTQSQDSASLPILSFPSTTSLPSSSLSLDSSMNLETLVTQLGKDVKAGKGLKVVDFDEHLEDTSLDWFNNKEVLQSIGL